MSTKSSLHNRWLALCAMLLLAVAAESCDGGGTSGTGVVVTDAGSTLESMPICGTALHSNGEAQAQVLVESDFSGEGVLTDGDGSFMINAGTSPDGGLTIVIHTEDGTSERIVLDEWVPGSRVVTLTRSGQVALFECQ